MNEMQHSTSDAASVTRARTVINYHLAKYETYYLQGEAQPDLDWCNISYDSASGDGMFLVRFHPGGRSIPHEHLGYEEFMILQGELTDSDGYQYHAGDVVSLTGGSRHWSKSATGAVILVFVRGGFRTLAPGEAL